MIQTQTANPRENGGLVRPFFVRHNVYKLGFCLLFVSFFIYVYSFVSSSWFESLRASAFGLWRTCRTESLECDTSYNVLLTVRIISFICMAGFIITLFIGLLENFRPLPANYHSRKLEWSVFATASVGALASILFLVYFTHLSFVFLGSSFFANVAALGLLFLTGGFLAYGNQSELPPDTSNMVMTTIPPQQTTVICYPGHQPAQAHIASYPASANPVPPQYNASYYPVMASPQPFPNQLPPSPPPPYSLPPAYPHQASHQPVAAHFYDHQRQKEVNAPLLYDDKMKPGMH